MYGLEEHRKDLELKGIIAETEENKGNPDVIRFNHSYYQGIILTIGNLRGLSTFSPNQDKNKPFCNETLGRTRSLDSLPPYSYPEFVDRSSTIDVISLNARNMPQSFFEVEDSTDIQNSLLKFYDLQDFNVRMFIVADAKRKDEYIRKLSLAAFKELREPRKRVEFIDYESIIKQYENACEFHIIQSTI